MKEWKRFILCSVLSKIPRLDPCLLCFLHDVPWETSVGHARQHNFTRNTLLLLTNLPLQPSEVSGAYSVTMLVVLDTCLESAKEGQGVSFPKAVKPANCNAFISFGCMTLTAVCGKTTATGINIAWCYTEHTDEEYCAVNMLQKLMVNVFSKTVQIRYL